MKIKLNERELIYIICALILMGCSKESKPDQITAANSIEVTELSPYAVIKSIRSFASEEGFESCLSPVPQDSSASLDLDLDHDGATDFTIETSHGYSSSCGSIHDDCTHLYFGAGISGHGQSVVAVDSSSFLFHICDYLKDSDYIGSNSSWNSVGVLVEQNRGAPFAAGYVGDSYYGLRLSKNDTTYFGWILISQNSLDSLIIKKYAINKKAGQSIMAGQEN